MNGRRKSLSDLTKPTSVTVSVARNEPPALGRPPLTDAQARLRTETVSSHEVKGFTQAMSDQRPTVYFQKGDVQRITQEHGTADNVGAHHFHGKELFFGNLRNNGALKLHERYLTSDKRTLTHTSRSAFQQVSSDQGRAALIDSLKKGPTNVKSLSYFPRTDGKRGGRDDWHVDPGAVYKTPQGHVTETVVVNAREAPVAAPRNAARQRALSTQVHTAPETAVSSAPARPRSMSSAASPSQQRANAGGGGGFINWVKSFF